MQSTKKPVSTADAKQINYTGAHSYIPTEVIQTGIQKAVSATAYTTYVTSHDQSGRKATVVFNEKSDERAKTLNANKRMASW